MALEALGVASNVAGLIDLGFSVCHGLWTYYNTLRDMEQDVKRMFNSVESLTKTFAVLKNTLNRPGFDASVVQRIEECVGMCEGGILCLHKKLKKIQTSPQAGSKWHNKVKAHVQRSLYPFKESTLVKLREVGNELQDHLRLALVFL